MSFARYPAYKGSGVEWLGEVPGHWEVEQQDSGDDHPGCDTYARH